MVKIGVLALVVLGLSCASDEPVDPVGLWLVQATPTTGNCQITEVQTYSLQITPAAGGYTIVDEDLNFTGTLICNEEKCDLSATAYTNMTLEVGEASVLVRLTLALDSEGKVTGTNSITFSGAVACTQEYSVQGVISYTD